MKRVRRRRQVHFKHRGHPHRTWRKFIRAAPSFVELDALRAAEDAAARRQRPREQQPEREVQMLPPAAMDAVRARVDAQIAEMVRQGLIPAQDVRK